MLVPKLSLQDLIKYSMLIAAACFLAACATQKSPLPDSSLTQVEEENPEKLLAMAAIETFEVNKNALLLRASQIYFEQGQPALAKSAILGITPATLTAGQAYQYWIWRLDYALGESDYKALKDILPVVDTQTFLRGDIDAQRELISKISLGYELLESHLKAAVTLIDYRGILLDDETLNERIWQNLSKANSLELNQFQSAQSNYDIKGWLELIRTIRYSQADLQNQYQALMLWQQAWPLHPANAAMPRELQILSQLPETHPDKIVLALPFTGPFARVSEAIRDGFLAHYYQSSEQKTARLEIGTYDTHTRNFMQLYDQNLGENTIIIGPLEKDTLATLLTRDSLPYRTLALNYLPSAHVVENLYQFSLNPEDETRQIAERLKSKRQFRVGILAPESEWGLRIVDSFTQLSHSNDTSIIEDAYYSSQKTLSSAVSRMLATDRSRARARQVRAITGLNLESTPRRRQDIDAVLMIAKPEFAKQLKPLLAYHYASDLDVYATSQVHDTNSPISNRDLNGIQFVDMPWTLNNSNNIRRQISAKFEEAAKKYNRFYAMGVDAFAIAPRLNILTEVENSHVDGQTGRISVDALQRIRRTLEWAKFKNGKAVILNQI